MKSMSLSVVTLGLISASCTTSPKQMETTMSDAPQPDPIHTDITEGPFVVVGDDGRLAYTPFTDRGDVIMDFSFCGYKASEEPIPYVEVKETLYPLEGEAVEEENLAYPMGPCSREQIQSAIDRVAAQEPDEEGFRGTVFLSKGTYYIHGGLTLTSGVVLRGEGMWGFGTKVYVLNPGGTAITMGTSGGEVHDHEPVVRIADDYVPSGSKTLTLEDASTFSVGDEIHVRKTVNQDWISLIGMDRIPPKWNGRESKQWTPEQYQMNHIRVIEAIDGNTLRLDVPLPQSFAKEHGGGEVNKISFTKYHSMMGVEGMTIYGNYDTSVTSDLRGNGEAYLSDEEISLTSGISIRKSVHAWVRGVTILHARRQTIGMSHSRFITVRDCKSLKPISVIRGGRRYSFSNSDSSMTLVYNCYAEEGRHDFVTGSRDTGPIAFVRGSALNARGPSETHHRWASGVLFDSITLKEGGGIQVINRGAGGSGQGWSGANGIIWNSTAPFIGVGNPPSPEQNFAIGTTATAPAEERFGGWKGDGHFESNGTPVEPESLFEKQLEDRIGAKQAYRVLARTLSKASLDTKVLFPVPVVDGVPQGEPNEFQQAFERAEAVEWELAMEDDLTEDWTNNWFLDGEGTSTITHSKDGMEMKATDTHMVLWTNESFERDVKIEYEFTRTDPYQGGVCIVYIQATGRGDEGYETDITKWNEYRESANMGFYFRNMHTYHVSYACGYLRGRRYRPDIQKMNTFSELDPEFMFDPEEMFELGATYQMTMIKQGQSIYIEAINDEKAMYFVLNNLRWDPVTGGRIGLRQMKGRHSIYKNFKVSVAK